jgi:hypothetical protein
MTPLPASRSQSSVLPDLGVPQMMQASMVIEVSYRTKQNPATLR